MREWLIDANRLSGRQYSRSLSSDVTVKGGLNSRSQEWYLCRIFVYTDLA